MFNNILNSLWYEIYFNLLYIFVLNVLIKLTVRKNVACIFLVLKCMNIYTFNDFLRLHILYPSHNPMYYSKRGKPEILQLGT